jgi:hypothetical protein
MVFQYLLCKTIINNYQIMMLKNLPLRTSDCLESQAIAKKNEVISCHIELRSHYLFFEKANPQETGNTQNLHDYFRHITDRNPIS